MRKCVGEEEDGSACSRFASRKQGPFWTCDVHGSSNWNFIRQQTRDKLIYDMTINENIRQHTHGITYLIYLPNANVKIGYSRDAETLARRVKDLSRTFNGKCVLIRALYGGESLEAFLHWKYRSNRIQGTYGEQFLLSKELIDDINEMEMCGAGFQALKILGHRFIETFNPAPEISRTSLELRRMNVQKVKCPKCFSPVGVPCHENGVTREANHQARAQLYSKELNNE